MDEKRIVDKREEEIGDAGALLKSLRKLNDQKFHKLVLETLSRYPIEPGYDSRCYCRRCNASWEMTTRGIQKLKDHSPNGKIKLPLGVTEQQVQDNPKNFYFLIEPCFRCKERSEKITSEVKVVGRLNGKN